MIYDYVFEAKQKNPVIHHFTLSSPFIHSSANNEAGSMEVQGSHSRRERQLNYGNLRKALCAGYANQLAERMVRHNGYRTLGLKSQLVQVLIVNALLAEDICIRLFKFF